MKQVLIFFLVMYWLSAFPQVKRLDSVTTLQEVTISNYGFPFQNSLRATSATHFIGEQQFERQQGTSLVATLNVVSGVRMEERSPGSYRLSLRGSLLRSPFGIRNVKIYIDEFPLTDAGGNTYLNLLDAETLQSLTIFKGPQASIFGANTGGAILIRTSQEDYNSAVINLSAGSYGLFHQSAKLEQRFKNYSFNVAEGYQQSDGYRQNSALKRKYIQTSHHWQYNKNGKLDLFAFYSDLAYQTPGGLTEAQQLADPRAARQATPTLPGAIAQQAGIYNQTIFGGLANSYELAPHLQYVFALFGNHTDFKNPFITNYEKRKESTYGIRTFINYHNAKDANYRYAIYLGFEGARTATLINNYENNHGQAAALMASDDLLAKQSFAFFKVNLDLSKRLLIELGASLNFFGYTYENYFPAILTEQRRKFKDQFMPKLAASYLLHPDFSIRASVSKGYSPPTLAEVRASDNQVNTGLQAEGGWNYETGLFYQSKDHRFTIDGNLFYFQLQNAIVRRLTTTDAEYFINAGGTRQLGTEVQASWIVMKPTARRFLDGITFSSSYTYSHFKFEDFKNAGDDFSGKRLTGVPNQAIVSSLDFTFAKGFYLFMQHNYTGAIPLNDANTFYSKSYHLADVKLGMRSLALGKIKLDLSFGINNVFNERYSLGNDLNAVGNRFFNPAADRNYLMSLRLEMW